MRVSENTILEIDDPLMSEAFSEPYPLEHLIGFSVQVVYTSDVNFDGHFIIEVSDDEENWSELVATPIMYLGCNLTINVREIFTKFFRAKVVTNTGTLLTLTAKVYAKGW